MLASLDKAWHAMGIVSVGSTGLRTYPVERNAMSGGFSVTMKVPAIRAVSRFEAAGCKTMDEIARCLRSKQPVLVEIDGIVGWTMEGGARVPLACTLRVELTQIEESTSERTVYKAYSSTAKGYLRVTVYRGEENLSASSVIAWSYT